MCAQIRVRINQAPHAAVAKHLTPREQKRLRKKGEVTITTPSDRKKQSQMKTELRAGYVS